MIAPARYSSYVIDFAVVQLGGLEPPTSCSTVWMHSGPAWVGGVEVYFAQIANVSRIMSDLECRGVFPSSVRAPRVAFRGAPGRHGGGWPT
jgi:hypothetical protein